MSSSSPPNYTITEPSFPPYTITESEFSDKFKDFLSSNPKIIKEFMSQVRTPKTREELDTQIKGIKAKTFPLLQDVIETLNDPKEIDRAKLIRDVQKVIGIVFPFEQSINPQFQAYLLKSLQNERTGESGTGEQSTQA